jgi:energy-converting hydrogenase Eha subunit A
MPRWPAGVALGLQGRRSELLPMVRALFGDDSPPGRYFVATTLLEQGDRAGAEAVAGPLLDLPAPPAFPADRTWVQSVAFACELAAALGARAACRWLYATLLPHADQAAVVGVAIAFNGAVAHYLGLLAAALDRPEEARAHFEHALAVHERLGARTWAARSRDRLAGDRRPTGAPASGGVFRRDGALWTLGYAGRTVRMRDAKGLRDLATLLGAPGRPVHAADLVAAAGPACSTSRRRSRRPTAGTTRSGPPGPSWNGTRWWPSWPPPPGWAAGPGGWATSRNGLARRSPPGSAT